MSTFRARCGIATHTLDLSEALLESGLGVFVAAEARTSGIDQTQTSRVPYERVFDREDPSSWNAIVPAAKRFGADILHIQHEHLIFPGDSFRRIISQAQSVGLKIVATFHSIPYFRDRALFSPMTSKVDLAISYSKEGLRSLKGAGFEQAEFVPHGVREYPERSAVDTRRILGLDPNMFIFSSSGFVSGPKGLVETLQVLKIVQKRLPDTMFVHAGGLNPASRNVGMPYLAYVDNMIKRLHIRKKDFLLTGYVPDSLVPFYGQASDMIVLNYNPSGVLSASGTFARAAVSLFRPIITVDGTMRIEEALHGETCWKVPFNNPMKMAEAILYLHDHPEIQNIILEGQRKYVLENNWARIAEKHAGLYENLIESARPIVESEEELFAKE